MNHQALTALQSDPFEVVINGKHFPFTSYADVSEAYCHARDAIGATISGRYGPLAPRCHVIDEDGNVVAHVSYNGRVWPGAEWETDATPLYDPRERG